MDQTPLVEPVSKVGLKELRLEPKFLNRGLRSHKYHINNIGHVATAPGP